MNSFLRVLYLNPIGNNPATTGSEITDDMYNDTAIVDSSETDSTPDNTHNVTTIILVTSFIVLTILAVILGKREERRHVPPPSSTKPVKSPDAIESMLVLKNVRVATEGKRTEKKTRRSVKYNRRRKSSLILRLGWDDDDVDQSQTCAICLCDYEDGEKICWSRNQKCTHCFHAQCGIHWLTKHTECPVCREEYLIDPEASNNNVAAAAAAAAAEEPTSSVTIPETHASPEKISTIAEEV